ncbi:MAG: LysM peptidoglycan-binding domain-containing protein [Crocinitomicaceae bacterium]
MKKAIIAFLIGISFNAAAQVTVSPEGERFVSMVEQSLNAFYAEYANGTNYDSIMKALNYEANEIPEFSDEVYCQRLALLDNMSPFEFACNAPSLSIVKYFVANRRNFARVVLGRSALYFDLFEETLAKYDMPVELKYLAVIESGLRPQVKSRAGALGLWQFMYRTGLYYGLNENSYIDERMDPVLATDAACRYLKKLYEIYNDWNMALAAYNAGPGNVNKAIRRSGGKTTYWEVRPFLPRETQGYVPNFIGAAYLLTYHKEHNIVPFPAKIHNAQLDTLCLKNGVRMERITELTGWDLDEIKALNPIYKTNYIPKTDPPQCITGPMIEIGKIIPIEDQLYAPVKVEEPVLDSTALLDSTTAVVEENGPVVPAVKVVDEGKVILHTVRRGESLNSIAQEYGVTIADIQSWNNLTGTRLNAGQRLKIGGKAGAAPVKPKPVVKTYTVRSGDTFSKIAQRHGLTQTQLKRLNPGVNVSRLDIGQKLRVK